MVCVRVEVEIAVESGGWARTDTTGQSVGKQYDRYKDPGGGISVGERKRQNRRTIGSWDMSSCEVYECSGFEGSPTNGYDCEAVKYE